MRVAVLTVDQRASRTGPDLVPATLDALAQHRSVLPFERTVGDELQGAIADPDSLRPRGAGAAARRRLEHRDRAG